MAALLIRFLRNNDRIRNDISAIGKSWLRLMGPAFAVSVGYVDPGNWATDLAAGAYGYELLWAVVLAGAVALVLQITVAKLALRTGSDLATLIGERWKSAALIFWFVFQAAAMATDLAEFSGIVLGIQLLFGIALVPALIWGCSTLAVLLLSSRNAPKALEYGLFIAVAAVASGILVQLTHLHPQWAGVVRGATIPHIRDQGALFALIGIVGATVMPHNLFLHSSLVVRSANDNPEQPRRSLIKFFTGEAVIALTLATVVNGGLLVIGAELTQAHGLVQDAFLVLQSHSEMMARAFGGALLISGVSASVTATIAGDTIFAAFSPIRVPQSVRRIIILLPTIGLLLSGVSLTTLLIWSQVILGLLLPVVLVPLGILIVERKLLSASIGDRLFLYATGASGAICILLDVCTVVRMAWH